MGNQMRLLSKPETDCEFESGTGKAFSYTAAAMQGWRKYQEDRYVCIPDFYDGCSFFGVFDGHGGSEVAEFLKRRLHLEIQDSLQSEFDIELALHSGFLSCDASLREPANIAELNDLVEEENRGALQILRNQESVDADMSEAAAEQAGPSGESTFTENLYNAGSLGGAVNQVFFQGIIASSSPENENSQQDAEERMQVERPLHYLLSDDIEPSDPGDEDYNYCEAEEISSESEESAESEEEETNISPEEFFNQEPGFLSGSTATVAIIRQNRIYVANAGDSRCVLSRQGRAVDLSLDHKPDDPEERARIIGAGGSISEDGRVNGCLNLSRAFGDFKFKGNSLEPSQQCITAEPFIKSIDIESEDDFLILASDGIWNSMSSQDVVDYINVRLQDGRCELEEICEEMFRLILAPDTDNDGSGCDNMCCIIVKFNKKGNSSFIYKACVSNEIKSSDGSLKQEGENVNTPTCGTADQMTTNISEKISPVDEKSIHQSNRDSHLTAQYSNHYMQHLGNSEWIDSFVRQRKSTNFIAKLTLFDGVNEKFVVQESKIKKIATDFSQKDMQCSVCSFRQKEILESRETIVPYFFEDILISLEKDRSMKKTFKI